MVNVQEYANKKVEQYIDLLNLYHWDIAIKVQSEEQYIRKHGKRFGNATNACANIYQIKHKARIFVKESLDKEKLENAIIHEMVHIPLNDLYVTGLTAFKDIDDNDKRQEYLNNWVWKLEASVCHITSALQGLATNRGKR